MLPGGSKLPPDSASSIVPTIVDGHYPRATSWRTIAPSCHWSRRPTPKGYVEAKIGVLAEDPWIHRRPVRVKVAGRLSLLPPSTVAVIRRAEEATADYDAMTLTIAVPMVGARRSLMPFVT